MKILAPRPHGIIDYLAVAMFALAPSLFGFGGVAATLCYVLAVVHLLMSLVTAYPLGLVKMLPFTVHGGVELLTAGFLLLAPWLFGFSEVASARNLFVIAGIALFLVYVITDYRAAERDRMRGPRQERVPSQA